MNAIIESVRSLWIPLSGINLLLPNVAIAEVTSYQAVDQISDGPDWLLGRLSWRDRALPLVSIERIVGLPWEEGALGARISVVNSVKEKSEIPFFAMVTLGIPRLLHADTDALGESVLENKKYPEVVADLVQIGSEEALIPNLEILQSSIEAEWVKYA